MKRIRLVSLTEQAIKDALAPNEERDIVSVMERLRATHGADSVDRALRRLGFDPHDFYPATHRMPALPRRDSAEARTFWLIPVRQPQ